jgi:hypothetical protein
MNGASKNANRHCITGDMGGGMRSQAGSPGLLLASPFPAQPAPPCSVRPEATPECVHWRTAMSRAFYAFIFSYDCDNIAAGPGSDA